MFLGLKNKLIKAEGKIEAMSITESKQEKKIDKLLRSNGIMSAKISELMDQVQQRDRIIEDLRN